MDNLWFILAILYGFIVGVIFSTTGAGGAILAGVGHISIFGTLKIHCKH